MKKIFVTGGGGFIGSHLLEKLVKLGYDVKTLVPYNIDNSWGWIDTFEKNIKSRATKCWNCHRPINTEENQICSECEVAIKCDCGKCYCDKPGSKIKKKHHY